MSDKQTIKQRVDELCQKNKHEYVGKELKDDTFWLPYTDKFKQELISVCKDHFIEMIDEEIKIQSVYYRKMLEQLKSKLMEGLK